ILEGRRPPRPRIEGRPTSCAQPCQECAWDCSSRGRAAGCKSALLVGAGFRGAGFLCLPHVAVEAAGRGASFTNLGLRVALAVAGILLALADGGIAQTALAARAG